MLSKLLGEFPKVIQMLREDHKQVRTLFRQYEKATNGKKPPSAHRILHELTLHAQSKKKWCTQRFAELLKTPKWFSRRLKNITLSSSSLVN